MGAHYAEIAVARGQNAVFISGNAPGSDQEFIAGATKVMACNTQGVAKLRTILCLPWPGFEKKHINGREEIVLASSATEDQKTLAAQCHDNWRNLGQGVQKLCIRNVQIIDTAQMVIANPNESKRGWGGTGHAIMAARCLGVPVFLVGIGRQRPFIDGEI